MIYILEKLKKLEFCYLCDAIIKNNEFHKSLYENLLIYGIKNKQNNYLCKEIINETLFIELYNDDYFIDWQDEHRGKKICGECIEEMRPYIQYIDDMMYIFLPYGVEL